jgi:hypothetical protein
MARPHLAATTVKTTVSGAGNRVPDPRSRGASKKGVFQGREAGSERRTELGDEEEEHDDGGGERDDAAGEGTAVEVLVHLGIGVQVAELGQEPVHGGRPTAGRTEDIAWVTAESGEIP